MSPAPTASSRRSTLIDPEARPASWSMCRAICRRSRPPTSRAARRAARRSGGRYRHAGGGDHASRTSATNPNVVKVVGSPVGPRRLRALYFTRATAPSGDGPLYHHIGLYAYRRAALDALRRAAALPARAARTARAVARARSRHAHRCRDRRQRAARRRHARGPGDGARLLVGVDFGRTAMRNGTP